MPLPASFPKAEFPKIQRATLSNGAKIALVRRSAVPLVEIDLMIDAGYAADQFAHAGTARLAMSMLDEGTKKNSSLEISGKLAELGATLETHSNLDMSIVSLSTLKSKINGSISILSEVVMEPSFPEGEFNRLKKQQLATIQKEKAQPMNMGLRVFPKLLYGDKHAYGNPLSGSGTEASVGKIVREDVIKFHETWFKPNNATFIIVGDITLQEAKNELERRFKSWKPGETPKKNIASVPHKPKSTIYIMDKPGAVQSAIFAGHVAPPKSTPDDIAIQAMNKVLGGNFSSRMNMNLREDKGWAYYARTYIPGARGPRLFYGFAPVQTDKTKEAMMEISKEMSGIRTHKPISPAELDKTKRNTTLKLPGDWETNSELSTYVQNIVRFGLPDNYYNLYPQKIESLTLAEVSAAAAKTVNPRQMVWVVVGDRSKIEKGIRKLGFGKVHLIDKDGNPTE